MPYDPNDPRLTAYALGELDEPEIAAIEAQLADCPDSRQAVAETRAAAALLTDELRREPSPGLAAEHREAIEGKLKPRSRIRRYKLVELGVAASLLALAGVWMLPPKQAARNPNMTHYAATAKIRTPADRVSADAYDDRTTDGNPDPFDLADVSGDGGGDSDRVVQGKDIPRAPSPTEARPIRPRVAPVLSSPMAAGEMEKSFKRLERSDNLNSSMHGGMGGKGGGLNGEQTRSGYNINPTRDHAYRNRKDLEAAGKPSTGPSQERLSEKESLALAKAGLHDRFGNDGNGYFELPEVERAPAGGEGYNPIVDNPFLATRQAPLSTFSIDVDTASYANMRRFLTQGALPPKDSIRIEEFVNYFPYAYPQPEGDDPFSINVEVARCPWDPAHRLARIGLKGREIATDKRPNSNLVFLIDVSGSMNAPNKLPLVQSSLRLLLEKLGEGDRVAIVVYAGNTGLVLPSTSCARKDEIVASIDRLQPGGSTNGASGIQLAYDVATANFLPGGTNRVILCTDGDFNVGITSQADLVKLIEQKAKRKVFLSVLGFGMGNLKDGTMEQLADKGDGNYAYIDTMLEARKVLVEQLSGTLVTIAKDVKIQVEFNPAKVASYRLIGYANRMLRKEDFNDDTKDAGEIGAGHAVTALYELVPAGAEVAAEGKAPAVDDLEFQPSRPAAEPVPASASPLALMVKLRYKQPEGDVSKLLKRGVEDGGHDLTRASDDFKFAATVASFGMILRDSPDKGNATLASVLELGKASQGPDPSGYRAEFLDLVSKARAISGR